MRLKRLGLAAAGLVAVSVLIHFPWHTGGHPQVIPVEVAGPESETADFYEDAYEGEQYAATAQSAAHAGGVKEDVERFVAENGLSGKRILEIGSGSGILQDVVADYTGSDIAASAARYYHKPFVVASATDLPFPDRSFDSVWTVWVLEHVPNPELALQEMRRVLRPGGLIYLKPAWNTPSWLAGGYEVKPYSALSASGKMIKASAGLRRTTPFKATYLLPIRFLRGAYGLAGETALRYRALTPNFETFWEADSDAVNSIDCYEAMLWWETRGDECLNCGSWALQPFQRCGPLIIRIQE